MKYFCAFCSKIIVVGYFRYLHNDLILSNEYSIVISDMPALFKETASAGQAGACRLFK